MKHSLTCPKCHQRKLWHVQPIDLAREVTVELDADMLELMGEIGMKASGPPTAHKQDDVHGFEIYVCAGCGYSEIYATSLEHVARVGRLVDGDATPYR